MDIEEVLVDNIHPSGAFASISPNILSFSSTFSVAASTTKSLSLTPSDKLVCFVMLFKVAVFCSSVIFSLLSILSKFLVMVAIPLSKAASEISIKFTSYPFCAKT